MNDATPRPDSGKEDPITAKVRALLATAEDASTHKDRRDDYRNKALEIMAKYGIDAAMLSASGNKSDPIDAWSHTAPAPHSRTQVLMLAILAQALRCKAVCETLEPRKSYRLELVGYSSDLDRVKLLWPSLLVQATQEFRRTARPPGTGATTWRRAFMVAFFERVAERLTATESDAATAADATAGSGPSTAVVLANRADAVEAEYARRFPRVRSRSVQLRGAGAAAGYEAGHAAGDRARLEGGTGVTNRTARAALPRG